MERIIGEIFEFGGEWYQCVKGDICADCAFVKKQCRENPLFEAIGSCNYRKDGKSICFKKLEKVGEPFTISGTLYQHYKVFDIDNVCGDVFWCVHNYKAKTLAIEIKQNKEDMKEKEPTYEELLHYYHSTVGLWAIDKSPQEVSSNWICDNAFQLGMDKTLPNFEKIGKNLKPFNLEAARSGKPVCTRDGHKARIICFDRIDSTGCNLPIVALIQREETEVLRLYRDDGKRNVKVDLALDLMMLPEKKEGWVNVYDADTTFRFVEGMVYNTKDEAIQRAKEEVTNGQREKNEYVDTVKISWEE